MIFSSLCIVLVSEMQTVEGEEGPTSSSAIFKRPLDARNRTEAVHIGYGKFM